MSNELTTWTVGEALNGVCFQLNVSGRLLLLILGVALTRPSSGERRACYKLTANIFETIKERASCFDLVQELGFNRKRQQHDSLSGPRTQGREPQLSGES